MRYVDVVAEQVARLRERYGEYTVTEETWTVDEDEYRIFQKRRRQGAVGGAGVLVYNDHGQVLLVQNHGHDSWSGAGGKIEPGETPEEAAKRECREETGIACRIEDLKHVTRLTLTCDTVNGEPLAGFIALFTGVYVDGEINRQEDEIQAVQWFDMPPDNLLHDPLHSILHEQNQ